MNNAGYIDTVACCDCIEGMKRLPDRCVDLVVTSPPYGVGIDYDTYDDDFEGWKSLIDNTLMELARVVRSDGRIAFNLQNAISPKTDSSLSKTSGIPYFYDRAVHHGFSLREWIAWVKTTTNPSTSTAWGSWMSPSNPHLCVGGASEAIIIMNRGNWARDKRPSQAPSITKAEFIDYTNNLWVIPIEQDAKRHHPAPFPIELPKRLIKLYTFVGDVVLDPFIGVGTTAVAASMLNRRYIGFDVSPAYVKTANERLSQSYIQEFVEH